MLDTCSTHTKTFIARHRQTLCRSPVPKACPGHPGLPRSAVHAVLNYLVIQFSFLAAWLGLLQTV